MYAKIFQQIYDSSIVEDPELRFTFMDMLVLADSDGVVDMTHEAIARRTNRPVEVIRKTITQLESPDPRSRTKDAAGARLERLDDHRDWGWVIINFDRFHSLATDAQRREKTKLRTRKYREKIRCCGESGTSCDAPVTHCDAHVTPTCVCVSSSVESLRGSEEGGKPKRLHGIPTCVEEVLAYGVTLQPPVSADTCRAFWAHYEGQARTNPNGDVFWITSGEAIVTNWKAKLPCFGLQDRSRNGPAPPPEQESITVRELNKELRQLERERSRNATNRSAV